MADGEIRGAQARVIDFDDPTDNDWLAVSQFTVAENKRSRWPDVTLFLNGLPLAVLELKNAADENATLWTAFQQLQTYKNEIASLFAMNALLVISDGVEARAGTLTAGREWFKLWRTIAGEHLADPHLPELQVVIEGVFAPARFLDLVRDFIVFEDDGGGHIVKKMAGCHQFHAVRVAVGETLRAAELRRVGYPAHDEHGRYESGQKPGGKPGDRRVGVVWHTQGSGKSLTMASMQGASSASRRWRTRPSSCSPDRNDLDDQLFGTYESRLAKLALDESERPKIDPDFEEATEGEEVERKEKLKTKWAQLEAVVGAEKRLAIVARDIVKHFEGRLEAMDGKAMIVCMSRRIRVELYRQIVKLRPRWESEEDERGAIKVVMTGSASDSANWQPHIRNKARREALAHRFRLPAEASAQAGDAADPLRLVLVRDMWLTGFDAPSLQTMYLDKPMRGHGLMQAIARVHRVFKDRPGGLVVDYLGLAQELKAARGQRQGRGARALRGRACLLRRAGDER